MVDLSDLVHMSGNEAILYAYLKAVARKRGKKQAFFELDAGSITRALSMSRRQIVHSRDRLVDLGKIAYIHGKNQNNKPRWKLL